MAAMCSVPQVLPELSADNAYNESVTCQVRLVHVPKEPHVLSLDGHGCKRYFYKRERAEVHKHMCQSL
jgi:hypothetical protein